jgi:hypothetical protein
VTAVDAGLAVEMVNVAVPPVRMLPGATESDTETLPGVGVAVAEGVGVGVGVGVPPELNAV